MPEEYGPAVRASIGSRVTDGPRPGNGLQWKVDEFLDRNLVMVEVALSGDAPVVMPEWLEPYVLQGHRLATCRPDRAP